MIIGKVVFTYSVFIGQAHFNFFPSTDHDIDDGSVKLKLHKILRLSNISSIWAICG